MKNLSLRSSLLGVALATGALLLIPFAAMRLTDEVSWGWVDFVLAGTLLFSAGSAVVLAVRRIKRPVQRSVVVFAICLTLALVWAELAVGLFR